jgi:hypothetical protein
LVAHRPTRISRAYRRHVANGTDNDLRACMCANTTLFRASTNGACNHEDESMNNNQRESTNRNLQPWRFLAHRAECSRS